MRSTIHCSTFLNQVDCCQAIKFHIVLQYNKMSTFHRKQQQISDDILRQIIRLPPSIVVRLFCPIFDNFLIYVCILGLCCHIPPSLSDIIISKCQVIFVGLVVRECCQVVLSCQVIRSCIVRSCCLRLDHVDSTFCQFMLSANFVSPSCPVKLSGRNMLAGRIVISK